MFDLHVHIVRYLFSFAMGTRFGPKVGYLSYLSCSDVACLTGNSLATLASPLTKLEADVSRDLGVHLTV